MVVYFILAVLNAVFAVLFFTNKYFTPGYINCPSEHAKKIYKISGETITSAFAVGFVFMGFYDLSRNLSNELIGLEAVGLFTILLTAIGFIFSIFIYHNAMIDYNKSVNEDSHAKEIEEDCKNIKE